MPSRTPVAPVVRTPLVSSPIGATRPHVVPRHSTHPSVSRANGFEASKVVEEPAESSVPAVASHSATSDSSPYISPISSPIDAEPCRYVRQYRGYQSNPRAKGFVQPLCRRESNVIAPVATSRANSRIAPQPYAAVYTPPARRGHAYELAPVSHVSSHRVPGVLHETGQVFIRSSVPFMSRAHCDTPRFVPSLPAHSASYARREYTSRIASSSSTSSSPARTGPIENGGDIGVSWTPSTRQVARDPHRLSPSFLASSATPAPRDCTSRVALASSRLPEPMSVVSYRNDADFVVYSQQDTGPVAPSAPHRAASPPYPTPSHSPIPPPVDPARPPTVAKYAPDVSEQSPRNRDHPEAERSCPPPVYARRERWPRTHR